MGGRLRLQARRRGVLADPARRLRDAAEPLAMHATGSPAVRAALCKLGLDRFQGYVGGRASSLGAPAPEVVVAAFGVFEPQHLRAAYEAAGAACSRPALVEARSSATVTSLRAVLRGEDVAGPLPALRRALSAASTSGRPLFAGLAGLPWPQDPLGQLWRSCELLREHRGDTHLSVCVAEGLDPVEMNVLTELWLGFTLGQHTRTRGWTEGHVTGAQRRLARRGLLRGSELTRAGWALRTGVEEATNRGQAAVLGALAPDVQEVVAALARWSQRCITAGTFTSDAAKRSAG